MMCSPGLVLLSLCLLLPMLAYGQEAEGTSSSVTTKQRAKAAKELGGQGSEAIPKLEPYLKDSEEDVRLQAVRSLTQIGTQHSLDPLLVALRDNSPEVKMRAIDGIVDFYLPGYVEGGLRRVGSLLKSPFSRANDEIIPAFVEVRPDLVSALGLVARKGTSVEARASAARAIGILRGSIAIPDLVEAVRSKEDSIIYESMIAIQKIRDPSAAPRISFLLRDLNEKVQVAAIETTGLLQNKSAVPDLQNVYDRARHIRVQRAALFALAMLPDESSRRYFKEDLADNDDQLRAAAAEGYGRLRNASDKPDLEAMLRDDKKPRPRLAAAFSLVHFGDRSTGEFAPLRLLVNSLNSRNYQEIAESYLIELARDPVVRSALYPLISTGTKDEKLGLSRVLAASGDAASVEYLEQLSKDPDQAVATEGLRALRTLKARL